LSGELIPDEKPDQDISTEEQQKFEKKRHKKLADPSDLYEILGISDLRWKATQDDIKAACTKHHFYSFIRF
jgi:hypothetical protein